MKLACKYCGWADPTHEYLGTNKNISFVCEKCSNHNFFEKVEESLLGFVGE